MQSTVRAEGARALRTTRTAIQPIIERLPMRGVFCPRRKRIGAVLKSPHIPARAGNAIGDTANQNVRADIEPFGNPDQMSRPRIHAAGSPRLMGTLPDPCDRDFAETGILPGASAEQIGVGYRFPAVLPGCARNCGGSAGASPSPMRVPARGAATPRLFNASLAFALIDLKSPRRSRGSSYFCLFL